MAIFIRFCKIRNVVFMQQQKEEAGARSGFLGERISFPDESGVLFSQTNFRRITKADTGGRIAFVDGGQGTLTATADTALCLLRSACTIMRGKRTQNAIRNEFTVKVMAQPGPAYAAQILQTGESFTFEARDSRMLVLGEPAGPVEAASVVRRQKEIVIAKECLRFLEPGDMIVLDGTLETRWEDEQQLLMELVHEAGRRNILTTALRKKSSLLTESGRSAVEMLYENGPACPWLYFPLRKRGRAELIALKLHASSHMAFFLEVAESGGTADYARVAGCLAANSCDLALPGYPYGLICADRLARVSNSEVAYLKAKTSGSAEKDVHGILDSLN